MNVLSLFDGLSGGSIALSRLGIQVDNYYASEIDVNAIKVAKHNFPNIHHIGDVTKVKSFDLPKIDLLIGGSPCQSFSQAVSSNTGFDGKSKLFFEYVRLLKECNPTYFLLENVEMKKEWEDVITEYLGVEPIHINSKVFSAQDRPRVYWTNIPQNKRYKNGSPLKLYDVLEENVPEKYFYKESFEVVNKGAVEAILNINGHDILKRVNSKDHKCQCLTAVCGGNQQKKVIDGGRVRKLTPLEYERLQTLPYNYTACVSDSARYRMIGNGWTVDVICYLLEPLKEIYEVR